MKEYNLRELLGKYVLIEKLMGYPDGQSTYHENLSGTVGKMLWSGYFKEYEFVIGKEEFYIGTNITAIAKIITKESNPEYFL